MALIIDMGADRLASTGILMPMTKHKWRVASVSILDGDDLETVRLQAIAMRYKYNAPVAKAFGFIHDVPHDFHLTIEEPITGLLAPIVKKLMTLEFDIVIENLDGDITSLKTTTFKGCTGVGYEYGLDYADSGSCKYPLNFKCKDIIYS